MSIKRRLTSRDEKILLLLKKFDYLTRDQLNQYFKFGTKSNTNRILNRLSDYLHSFRDGYQTIYYLSALGREYVECDKVRKKTNQVQHVILRNQVWLHYKCPKDWKNEVKISDGKTTVIADAVFKLNGFIHFLEVDRLQSMKENRKKIERYKALMDSLQRQFFYYPTVVWVTTTEHRRKQLEKACDGLKTIILTIDDIK